MDECLSLLDKKDSELLPHTDKEHIDFTLENTYTAFANAIRIVVLEECYVKAIDFIEMDTSDRYIVCDYIQKRIGLIPINQEQEYSDITISLDVANPTRETIKVFTRDLVVKNKGIVVKLPQPKNI